MLLMKFWMWKCCLSHDSGALPSMGNATGAVEMVHEVSCLTGLLTAFTRQTFLECLKWGHSLSLEKHSYTPLVSGGADSKAALWESFQSAEFSTCLRVLQHLPVGALSGLWIKYSMPDSQERILLVVQITEMKSCWAMHAPLLHFQLQKVTKTPSGFCRLSVSGQFSQGGWVMI